MQTFQMPDELGGRTVKATVTYFEHSRRTAYALEDGTEVLTRPDVKWRLVSTFIDEPGNGLVLGISVPIVSNQEYVRRVWHRGFHSHARHWWDHRSQAWVSWEAVCKAAAVNNWELRATPVPK